MQTVGQKVQSFAYLSEVKDRGVFNYKLLIKGSEKYGGICIW